MKARTKLLVALGLLAIVAARELGVFDFSLAQTASQANSSSTFSVGTRPETAYSAVTVQVLEAGEGEPEFRLGPNGEVSWTLVLEEPEFGGLQWLPLYKRMTYRVEVQAGNLEGSTVDGQSLPGKPEDGAPHGFWHEAQGTVTATGLQSCRGLREAVIASVIEDVQESLTESLLELEPEEETTGL